MQPMVWLQQQLLEVFALQVEHLHSHYQLVLMEQSHSPSLLMQ